MDTTETYIKMCDCKEIQEGHKWEDGDFWVWGKIRSLTHVYSKWSPPLRHPAIWLPTQSQLQAMVKVPEYPYTLIEMFTQWFERHNESGEEIDYESMEQLWLAFVMKELYDKVWCEDKWVRPGVIG